MLVLGYHAAGDGGGGQFFWDATSTASDNGGTVIVPSTNPPAGRWRRLVDGPLSVKWFGAKGDSSADDTGAIQAAIDALRRGTGVSAGVVFFPTGGYRITSTLNIIDDTQNGHGGRIQLRGVHGGASGAHRCSIQWHSNSGAPMLALHAGDCIVENLAFWAMKDSVTVAAIDIDNPTGKGAQRCSNNTFRHVQIRGQGGVMRDGVRLAQTAKGNVEFMRFTKCYFMDIQHACVHIPSASRQSKHHSFYDCAFQRAQYGIRTRTGSFQTYSCSFGALSTAIQLGSPTDNILIQDSDSEHCQRFLSTFPGNTAGAWAVSIIGGRYGVTNLPADGQYIQFTMGGPLVIQNAHFGPPAKAFRIWANCGVPGSRLIAIGNSFPNHTPYFHNGRHRRISLGNRGWDGVTLKNLDDEITSQFDAGGRVALSTVASISGTTRHAHNLRGTVAIAGTASSTAIAFPTAEPNTDYRVYAIVAFASSQAPVESTRVRVAGKTATGFRLVVEKPPGTGQSVSVDWLVVR